MSIKGESHDPKMSYIEEMIKKPLEDLKLFGQQIPAFKDVEVVQGEGLGLVSMRSYKYDKQLEQYGRASFGPKVDKIRKELEKTGR